MNEHHIHPPLQLHAQVRELLSCSRLKWLHLHVGHQAHKNERDNYNNRHADSGNIPRSDGLMTASAARRRGGLGSSGRGIDNNSRASLCGSHSGSGVDSGIASDVCSDVCSDICRGIGRDIGRIGDSNPIGASEASAVIVVDNEAAVSEEGDIIGVERHVVVDVLQRETWKRRDVTMFTGKVTNLTGLWNASVARWVHTTTFGIQVFTSGIAATVGWDGILMDVVHCVRLA